MPSFISKLAITLCCCLLAGCQTTPDSVREGKGNALDDESLRSGFLLGSLLENADADYGDIANERAFKQQWQWLKSNPNWEILAKVGIKTPELQESANLIWQQRSEKSSLRLFGPLGTGTVRIEFDKGKVVLIDAKAQRYRANNANELLTQVTGWPIPLSDLRYWMMALPSPNVPYEFSVNERGRLDRLVQKGWSVEYSRYQDLGHAKYAVDDLAVQKTSDQVVLLPRKIVAKKSIFMNGKEQTVSVRFISKSLKFK